MDWARMLADITGTVDQELLLRNEYLAADKRILRAQIKGRLLLSDAEKKTLADIGNRLGREALKDVADAAKPDTIMSWYRKLIARKFDGSNSRRYLIHDRDTKFMDAFRRIIKSSDVEPLNLPARSPNLNAYADRWVRSVKEEALSKLILFGEASLRRVLRDYVTHFHEERNHQGKGNVLLFPSSQEPLTCRNLSVCCRERLGGLFKYYHREAA